MNKGQMEMLGLLVIVILLLVIGVIVLRFSTKPSLSTFADSRSSLEGTKLLQALVLTTLEGTSFQNRAVACSQDAQTCLAFRQALEGLFPIILREGQQYSFYLTYQDQNLLTLEHCSTGVVSSYPFVASGGFYEAQLRLCTALS